MKTLLAIALVAAALTIGTAVVGPISGTAVAGGGGPDRWCGAAICHDEASGTPRVASDTVRVVSRAAIIAGPQNSLLRIPLLPPKTPLRADTLGAVSWAASRNR